MDTDFTLGFSRGAFFILPVLSVLVTTVVVVVAIVVLWRIMRAQEATAGALRRIADAIERRPV